MRARPSLSLIFLGRLLLQETLSTFERWLLVLPHICATDDLEISHFCAISHSNSPMFSLRNQTLAHCSAEKYCETVCSCNWLTVNLVYSFKYCMHNYATKQVLRNDEFKIVVFKLQRKVSYKTPDIFQTCSSYDNSLEKPQKTHFPRSKTVKTAFFGRGTNSDNHGQKSWDSCTVRMLFNTCEIVSTHY